MQSAACRRSLVGPILLIILGIAFLLNNLGCLGWSAWETILRLWPVILIAFGLEMVLGRGSAWGSLATMAVVLTVAGLMVILPRVAGWQPSAEPGGTPWNSEYVSEPSAGVESAEISIGRGNGALNIGPLTDPEMLIEGTVQTNPGERLKRDYRVEDGKARFTLTSEGTGVSRLLDRRWREGYSWDLRLNRQVPIALEVKTGVGTATIDLRGIRVTELCVRSGIGRAEGTLPESGDVRVRIEGGIGEAVIRIPKGLPARIHVRGGIGAVEVTGDYRIVDGEYVSPGFEAGGDRVDLEIKGGIGKIVVEEAARGESAA